VTNVLGSVDGQRVANLQDMFPKLPAGLVSQVYVRLLKWMIAGYTVGKERSMKLTATGVTPTLSFTAHVCVSRFCTSTTKRAAWQELRLHDHYKSAMTVWNCPTKLRQLFAQLFQLTVLNPEPASRFAKRAVVHNLQQHSPSTEKRKLLALTRPGKL
jgi:hypothetical protein